MNKNYIDGLHVRDLNDGPGVLLKLIERGELRFKIEDVDDLDDFKFRYEKFGQMNSVIMGEHVYGNDPQYYTIIRGGVELNYLLNLAKYGKVRLDKNLR